MEKVLNTWGNVFFQHPQQIIGGAALVFRE